MHALLLLGLLASPRVVAELSAAQVVAVGDRLVALEPDLLHLRGLDRDGKPRWRKRFQAEARGIQALFVHDGRVLLYAGEQARWVDAATGERGPAIPVPYLSSPGHPGCWLNHVGGAYAFYCPCEFRFAQADGAPLGEPYRFHQRCERDYDGNGSSCGCWGSSGDLIGRAGDLALARVEEPPTPAERHEKRSHYGDLLVAVSVKTGQEVWRQPAPLGQAATYIGGLGVLPDGRTFFNADAAGRITAHDAATGGLLWRDPPADADGERPHQPGSRVVVVPPDGLFFFANGQATLFDARSGQVRWRHALPDARLALPATATEPLGVQGPGPIHLLRPADGQPAAVLTLTAEAGHLLPVGDRVIVRDGSTLRLHAPDGTLIGRATGVGSAAPVLVNGLVAQAGPDGMAFFDPATLAPLGAVAGDDATVEPAPGPRRVLVVARKGNRIKLIEVAQP
ncbi:MAG: PQQ-binding-like beta-propeller repeat protein [bacterium]